MSSSGKLKVKLNRDEIKAFLDCLNMCDLSLIEDVDMRNMTRFFIEKIFIKLANKVIKQADRANFTYTLPEISALHQALYCIDLLSLPPFEQNLIRTLISAVDQKLA
jgi:hypothetical protein